MLCAYIDLNSPESKKAVYYYTHLYYGNNKRQPENLSEHFYDTINFPRIIA